MLNTSVCCNEHLCVDVAHDSYVVPRIALDPTRVSVILISEAAPADCLDYYYADGNPLFEETTVQAFRDAGVGVSSIKDILDLGVYLTTAVKCGKIGYGIKAPTIRECSLLLEAEIGQFANVRSFLLMGDVAIKAMNCIAKKQREPRVIPTGSTYRIRGPEYYFRSARAFPSYLQAGPSFFIEKSKRRMIGEDIAAALSHART